MSAETASETNTCPGCGARFICGMKAGAARCWCAELPAGLPLPRLDAPTECYCPSCLKAWLDGKSAAA